MITHGLFTLLFAPQGQGGASFAVFLFQIAAIFAIFYFLIIRPHRKQQEQHKQLLASLQRGDHVVTSGGLVGEVIHLKDDHVTVRTGEARVVVVRSSIATITNRAGGGAGAKPDKSEAKAT